MVRGPPFNSSATYNVLFKEKSGEESAAQIMAFEDTWQWSKDAEAVYREIVESGPRKLADLMQALLAFLGRNDMMANLVMMGIRRASSRGEGDGAASVRTTLHRGVDC